VAVGALCSLTALLVSSAPSRDVMSARAVFSRPAKFPQINYISVYFYGFFVYLRMEPGKRKKML
jgi:hypothetical protein